MDTLHATVFLALSVDGFIARRDGRIDWLESAQGRIPPGEDCGFAALMASVDAIVMGRKTFETVLGFGFWPYGDKPLIVLSRTGFALPESVPASVSVTDESPTVLAERLAAAGMRRVYVDGGQTVGSFLAAGLVDTLVLTTVPVILGDGTPLTGALPRDIWLEPVETIAYPFGLVQTRYQVGRE